MLASLILLCVLINDFHDIGLSQNIKQLTLNDGNQIPILGLGTLQMIPDRVTSQVQLNFRVDDGIVTDCVLNGIEIGYRLIDTSYIYNTEKGVGQALNISIESGEFKREDFFITTKIWNTFHSRAKAVENLNISLNDLGLDYVDLTLMQFPMGFKSGLLYFPLYFNLTVIPDSWMRDTYIDTWKGLEDAKNAGLTKSIGVTNFNIRQMKFLLENTEIKPVVNQVECNPFYNQNKMLKFLNEQNIKMIANLPLRLRRKSDLLNHSVLKLLSQKYNKTLVQISLRWNIQRGVIVIPMATDKEILRENYDVFDFNLDQNDMQLISNFSQKTKIFLFEYAANHPDYPFNED